MSHDELLSHWISPCVGGLSGSWATACAFDHPSGKGDRLGCGGLRFMYLGIHAKSNRGKKNKREETTNDKKARRQYSENI